MLLSSNNKQQQPPEYSTDIEYIEQQLLFTTNMHHTWLEQMRKCESVITDLQNEAKKVETPELLNVIRNMIQQQQNGKKQLLEYIKRARKDLTFINSIYKKLKRLKEE